ARQRDHGGQPCLARDPVQGTAEQWVFRTAYVQVLALVVEPDTEIELAKGCVDAVRQGLAILWVDPRVELLCRQRAEVVGRHLQPSGELRIVQQRDRSFEVRAARSLAAGDAVDLVEGLGTRGRMGEGGAC